MNESHELAHMDLDVRKPDYNKGADQTALARSLTCIFVIRSLQSIIV